MQWNWFSAHFNWTVFWQQTCCILHMLAERCLRCKSMNQPRFCWTPETFKWLFIELSTRKAVISLSSFAFYHQLLKGLAAKGGVHYKWETLEASWLVVPLLRYMSHCICVAGMEAVGNQRREDGWVRCNSRTNDAFTRNEWSYYQRLAVTLARKHTLSCCTQPLYTFMFVLFWNCLQQCHF